jgi:ferredoxin
VAAPFSRIEVEPWGGKREEGKVVTYVIIDSCVGTKDHSCTEVCPVDCIHPTPEEPGFDEVEQLFIDPEECIDCNSCVEACPVDACVADHELSPGQQASLEKNAAYFRDRVAS